MKVAACTMMKDEADIVEGCITRMLEQVDEVIVADNNSTDGTREILEEVFWSEDVVVLDDPDVAYYQSHKMSHLARYAADRGAEWVIPFDADEVWLAKDRRIADVLSQAEGIVATAAILNHTATGGDDPDLPPIDRMGWRRKESLGLPKIACRPKLDVFIEQGNHGANYPSGIVHDLLTVHHFPYRSPEQFVRKAINGAAAYAATNLDRGVGQHWREYGEMIEQHGKQAGEDWFHEHFWVEHPEDDDDLIYDPV